MTMFIRLTNGKPEGYAVTEENLKALFPDHKFPKIFRPGDTEPLGFALYEWSQIPETVYPNKVVETVPTLRDGTYYQTWDIVEMSENEKTEATLTQSRVLRLERDHRLRVSDWTQLSDAQLSEAQKQQWLAYRQALRDVPTQSGFPWNVTWPTLPE